METIGLDHRFHLGEHGTWLEQAGEVELLGGWAQVALSERIVERVNSDDYEVYVSSYDAAVVFVRNRTATSFEIHAMPAPDRRRHATVVCAYRLVAREGGGRGRLPRP